MILDRVPIIPQRALRFDMGFLRLPDAYNLTLQNSPILQSMSAAGFIVNAIIGFLTN